MLRILKRIISGVLTLSMVISVISFAPVYAATEFKNYEISDSLPQGWEIGTLQNASIDIAELSGEKCILLSNDTSASKATAKAELFSESFKLSGKQIFSYRMAVSNSIKEATYKLLFLNDGANEYELLEIKKFTCCQINFITTLTNA